jgi:hydrogenase maturation protein HypF
MSLAHLWAAGIAWDPDLAPVAACPPDERRALAHQLGTNLGCVPTSSMGRLFDAVSSLAGVRHIADYEAQAAIELEGLSRDSDCGDRTYAFGIDRSGETALIDPTPVLQAVVKDRRASVAAGVIGARFHCAVADLIVDLTIEQGGARQTVALSGGVFQNALLLTLTLGKLRARGIQAMTHRRVPPNDGGIALGQLLIGNSG